MASSQSQPRREIDYIDSQAGLYDGPRYAIKIDGEPENRLEISAAGDITKGDGTAPPTTFVGGREIGYTQSVATTTSASGTGTLISGMSVIVPAHTRPLRIEFGGIVSHTTQFGGVGFLLQEDGVTKFDTLSQVPAANSFLDVHRSARLAADVAQHTYTLRIYSFAGAATASAVGAALNPVYLWVYEV